MRKTVSSSAALTAPIQANTTEDLEAKLEKIRLLEKKLELQYKLPHLYGFKLYKWQREFIEAGSIESGQRVSLLCAGNQIGKSASNILKCLRLAMTPEIWPKYFPHRRPHVFWFLMPTRDMITSEFHSKWKTEFLPKEEYKDHPQYGWTEEIRNRQLIAIHFNTGITCYFRSYEMDVHSLQAGSVDSMHIDEEPKWELMPELLMRLSATNGLLSASMTPTRGQEQWRRAFEVRGTGEIFPDAFKKQVSIFDCKHYEDGTPSRWTDARINQLINQLGTQQEIDLRIYGKFVAQEGLVLSAFKRDVNIQHPTPMGKDWFWYSGVDLGGGAGGSLPAIVFCAVRPDMQFGRIVKVWRGSSTKVYTASDVLDKYLEMRGNQAMAGEYYDYSSKDFGIIAQRSGVGFMPAEKSRDIGFPMMNTLFKNSMLIIDDTPDNHDLINEIINLRHGQNKRHAADHLVDAARYCVVKIPWSMEGIAGERLISAPAKALSKEEERMQGFGRPSQAEADLWSVDDEIALWNQMLDPEW